MAKAYFEVNDTQKALEVLEKQVNDIFALDESSDTMSEHSSLFGDILLNRRKPYYYYCVQEPQINPFKLEEHFIG